MKRDITPQNKNFAKWYQDVVREADLAEASEVRGCGIVKPYGYKIWELIKEEIAKKIEQTGAQNVYFPLFIPIENLEAEKEHVQGFSPELAVVTHAGGEDLENKLVVRPTSETSMYKTYAKWIQSYRDLPLRLNQWNNVVRWEKRPRPFLRWSEFLWQEGHSAFTNKEDAVKEVWQMLDIYEQVYMFLAIPVFKGKKSEMEKFAGGDMTTVVEIMVKDGKAIQGATSHYLGTNFAKVFNVKYLGEDEKEHYAHQTSWGFAWRAIGALIMVHGDDNGLKLPPNVAPIQVEIIPIYKNNNKTSVLEYANKIKEELKDFRVHIDSREELSPGYKFNECEVKGIPIRFEIGEKEVTENSITIFRRDTGEKVKVAKDNLKNTISEMFANIHENLFSEAKDFAQKHITRIESIDEIKNQVGFFEASWCESIESEKLLKERFSMVSRVLTKESESKEPKNKKCFITGKNAKHDWLFAKSY